MRIRQRRRKGKTTPLFCQNIGVGTAKHRCCFSGPTVQAALFIPQNVDGVSTCGLPGGEPDADQDDHQQDEVGEAEGDAEASALEGKAVVEAGHPSDSQVIVDEDGGQEGYRQQDDGLAHQAQSHIAARSTHCLLQAYLGEPLLGAEPEGAQQAQEDVEEQEATYHQGHLQGGAVLCHNFLAQGLVALHAAYEQVAYAQFPVLYLPANALLELTVAPGLHPYREVQPSVFYVTSLKPEYVCLRALVVQPLALYPLNYI